MKKLVSILVPVYNVENFIDKCIVSIFNQTYKEIEYVFINDCSKDNSMKIIFDNIKKYKIDFNRITIVNHEENRGIAETRNDCLKYAKGEYMIFIDSDDWIDYDMIEIMINEAEKSEAEIVGCGYIEEFKDKSIVYMQEYTNNRIDMLRRVTSLRLKGTLWKLLIKRSLVVNNNLSFIPDIVIGEDYIFCCKLFYYSNKTVSINRCPYHYVRYNPYNYSNYSLFNIESQIKAIEAVQEFYIKNNIYCELIEELNFRKFTLKSSLLLNPKISNIKFWREIFPESNYMWKKIQYSYCKRFIFLLAQSPFYFLINTVYKIKKLKFFHYILNYK